MAQNPVTNIRNDLWSHKKWDVNIEKFRHLFANPVPFLPNEAQRRDMSQRAGLVDIIFAKNKTATRIS